jgi:Terminase large subunit, T4likevirus-type, N-terminal
VDKWIPQPGSQVHFLSCPVFECLLEGTRGGGKTDALLMSFVQFIGQGYGAAWRGILFRETYPQLADVVKKSKRWFKLFFPLAKFNEADFVWKFPGGEELLFRHGVKEEDYWNYHGHEYPWIGFEELTNWRDPAFYEAMFSCCRSSQPGMPRMVRATTNPYGRGHGWVKERFGLGVGGNKPGTINDDGKGRLRTYVHSDLRENKILTETDPDYIKTLEGLKDPNRRKAWLEGSWDIHVGAFLEHAWDAKSHIVKPFPIPKGWKVWRSLDWGYAKPYSVHWFALDPDGCYYIWRELYGCAKDDNGKFLPNTGTKESPEAVAKRIAALEANDERMGYEWVRSYAGTDIFGAAGKQYGVNHTIAQVFKENGVSFAEAWTAKGSRVAGAMEIVRLLQNDQLKVFSTCIHWLRTVPSLAPDPENPDDVDTEMEDHAWDETRYGIMRRRAAPEATQIAPKEDTLVQIMGDGRHQYKPNPRPAR